MTNPYLPHPTKVEAVQLTVDNLDVVAQWVDGEVLYQELATAVRLGKLTAWRGDWIIKHPTLGLSVVSDEAFKILYYAY